MLRGTIRAVINSRLWTSVQWELVAESDGAPVVTGAAPVGGGPWRHVKLACTVRASLPLSMGGVSPRSPMHNMRSVLPESRGS